MLDSYDCFCYLIPFHYTQVYYYSGILFQFYLSAACLTCYGWYLGKNLMNYKWSHFLLLHIYLQILKIFLSHNTFLQCYQWKGVRAFQWNQMRWSSEFSCCCRQDLVLIDGVDFEKLHLESFQSGCPPGINIWGRSLPRKILCQAISLEYTGRYNVIYHTTSMDIKLRNSSHTIQKIPFVFGCHQVEVFRGLEIEMYRKEYFQCD